MAAIAERAVNGEFAWLRIKHLHDFADHHRPVHARRRFTALDHLIDVGRIALRVVLFVFFGKMPRILPFVPRSAFWFFRTHGSVFPRFLSSLSSRRRSGTRSFSSPLTFNSRMAWSIRPNFP